MARFAILSWPTLPPEEIPLRCIVIVFATGEVQQLAGHARCHWQHRRRRHALPHPSRAIWAGAIVTGGMRIVALGTLERRATPQQSLQSPFIPSRKRLLSCSAAASVLCSSVIGAMLNQTCTAQACAAPTQSCRAVGKTGSGARLLAAARSGFVAPSPLQRASRSTGKRSTRVGQVPLPQVPPPAAPPSCLAQAVRCMGLWCFGRQFFNKS